MRAHVAALLLLALAAAQPPDTLASRMLLPDSSVERTSDAGVRSHTNHMLLVGSAGGLGPSGGMTPSQIRSFYNLPSTGGSGVIAIIDAYHYPTALSDFNFFSSAFGLPTEPSSNPLASSNQVFQVVYASGTRPTTNGGWAQEAALDTQWAHAIAPNAKIVLVEASSSSMSDLLTAVDVARNTSTIPNVAEISMSWSTGEFSLETLFDSHFPQNNGIVYLAASGDTGGLIQYPASSTSVIGVGGSSVSTTDAGVFSLETGWSGSGGGISSYEPKPSYQQGILNTPTTRGVPDISFDANPSTGVSVYDTTISGGLSGWLVFGGTSVACPCVAGVVNLYGNSLDTATELSAIYQKLGTSSFRDITSGKAGNFNCATGWDFVTGVGSPLWTGGTNVAALKLTTDNSPVSLPSKVVTAVFSGYFYAEEPSRTAGIKVVSNASVSVGEIVSVAGRMATAGLERQITAVSVAAAGGPLTLGPLGMSNLHLGGGNDGLQQGVVNGYGISNIGLLVHTWGKVTQVGAGYLYIDDGSLYNHGSRIKDGTVTGLQANVGVRVICDPAGYTAGDYLSVTGISSCLVQGSQIYRELVTRSSGDVRLE